MSSQNEPKKVETFLVTRGSMEIEEEVKRELEEKETKANQEALEKAIAEAQRDCT